MPRSAHQRWNVTATILVPHGESGVLLKRHMQLPRAGGSVVGVRVIWRWENLLWLKILAFHGAIARARRFRRFAASKRRLQLLQPSMPTIASSVKLHEVWPRSISERKPCWKNCSTMLDSKSNQRVIASLWRSAF